MTPKPRKFTTMKLTTIKVWTWPTERIKKDRNKNTGRNHLSELVFRFFASDAGIGHFWPEIRTLRGISSPEPAGNVRIWNSGRKIRKHMFNLLFLHLIMGSTVVRRLSILSVSFKVSFSHVFQFLRVLAFSHSYVFLRFPILTFSYVFQFLLFLTFSNS